ncbi:MAG: 2-hydroxyacid dehydrogenase [Candidatus Thorarchaeota archaeon]
MKEQVFVTRKIPGKGIDLLQERCDVDVWENESPPSPQQIIDRAKNSDGLITLLSDKIDRSVINALPKLRVIAQYAVGYDNIDVLAATERSVVVTNTPGVLTETTADLTWSLIMSVSRRIPEADQYVRKGHWQVAWGPEMLLGVDVFGATLGIIGLGRIGAAVAKRAIGFDMKVLYHTRSESDFTKEVEKEFNLLRTDLEALLAESDIVTIHVPLTPETNRMIGKEELYLMKEGSIFINTSRGAVVDENALYNALKNGHLRGAGLDVFSEEPTPYQNPLLELSNIVVGPHIGSASISTRNKMGEMCTENVIAVFTGDRPPNVVNPEVLDQLH